MVVTQRPRDLTRAQLKELRLLLDQAGYKENYLLINILQRVSIGNAVVPYSQRVDKAIANSQITD